MRIFECVVYIMVMNEKIINLDTNDTNIFVYGLW